MSMHPSRMDFGRFSILSPDGSDAIPPDLWPELELVMLLEPEPIELKAWVRRLERALAPPRPISTGTPWAILGVTPLMERKVAETLRDAGLQVHVPIETYLPKSANVARAHRPWRPRTRPLIPGIVFALLETERDLDIARANHAVRLNCREGRVVTVPSLAIGTFVLFEAMGAFDSARKVSGAAKRTRRKRRGKGVVAESRWVSGQRVKIAGEGAFAGFWGHVFRERGDGVVDVLVTLFGRETPVTIDEDMIEEGGA